MYRIWYWAMIDRESDGRFIASIPDLGDLAAYGDTDKDAVAHVTELAAERVRSVIPEPRKWPVLSSQSRLTAEQRGQRRPTIFLLELFFCHGEAIP
jgi:predicted RNase H-like HicB family nuclease